MNCAPFFLKSVPGAATCFCPPTTLQRGLYTTSFLANVRGLQKGVGKRALQ